MRKYLLAFLLIVGSAVYAITDGTTQGRKAMTTVEKVSPSIPPEIVTYIKGASEKEHYQFDFLIGFWNVEVKRYNPDGTKSEYKAAWEAKYLNSKRMIFDDFKALSPDGKELSSFVTLRTFSPITNRWEIAGLGAHLPNTISEWYGQFMDERMQLDATGLTPDGKKVNNRVTFYDISRDQFSWESNLSFDDGVSWVKVASLVAVRFSNKQ